MSQKERSILLILVSFVLIIGSFFYYSKIAPNFLFSKHSFLKNCSYVPSLKNNSFKKVTKVLDGDTFLIEGGYSVRILGIDADEKGYPCYEEAKRELEKLILGKVVRLEKGKEDLDRYCRYLRYVFLDKKNIGVEMVKKGLVVARFSSFSDENYKKEIERAEKLAREKKVGCKWKEVFEKKNFSGNFQSNLKWERLTKERLGYSVIEACEAKKYFGRKLIMEGKIVDSYRSPRTNTVFLNFGDFYPNQCFTAVIFNSFVKNFDDFPEKYYLGKIVRVFGEIREYKGKPEVILKDPSQIEIGKQK